MTFLFLYFDGHLFGELMVLIMIKQIYAVKRGLDES